MTDKDQQSFKNLSGRSRPEEIEGNRIAVSELALPPIDEEVFLLMDYVDRIRPGSRGYSLILRRLLYERERINRELTKALTVVTIARRVRTDERLNRAVLKHDSGVANR